MDKRKRPDIYAFPAIFEVDHEDNDVLNVTFPDLPNCFANGQTEAEAMVEAREALENVLYWMENDNCPIPAPSDIRAIRCEGEQFASLVVADMNAARRAWENRSVSRTITLPAWLDELARQRNLNFSQELQVAIKHKLGVEQNPRSHAH